MDFLIALGMPNGSEWFFLAVIFILLFGAKKLPELAKGLGQSFGEFRKAKEEFEREIQKSTATAEPPAAPAPVISAAPVAAAPAPAAATPVDVEVVKPAEKTSQQPS